MPPHPGCRREGRGSHAAEVWPLISLLPAPPPPPAPPPTTPPALPTLPGHLDGLGNLNPLGDGHVTGVKEGLALQHPVDDPLVGAGRPAGGGGQAHTQRPLRQRPLPLHPVGHPGTWPRALHLHGPLLPEAAGTRTMVPGKGCSTAGSEPGHPQEEGRWQEGSAARRGQQPGGQPLPRRPAGKTTGQPGPRPGKQDLPGGGGTLGPAPACPDGLLRGLRSVPEPPQWGAVGAAPSSSSLWTP